MISFCAMPRLLVILSLLLVACAAPRAQKAKPAPPPKPTLSPEQKAARARRREQVDRIAKVVARVRRLALKRPLSVGWIGADDVKKRARQAIERELGAEWIAGYAAAYSRLGLLPEGYDYVEELLAILGEQVAGFYDSEAKQLFVRHDMPADEIVLAHEIGHALQDQHFDLEKMQGDIKENDDRNFAVTALIEGDATLVMERYISETLDFWKGLKLIGSAFRMAAMDNQKLDAAPLFIKEGMIRPYMDGWALAKKLRAMGGQAAIDRAFARPPASSEQVLHLGKYLAQEAPVKVTPPDLLPTLGRGWKVLHENTLGEFGVSILLRTARLGAGTIGPASRGWGGDRFRAYRHHKTGRMALIWVTAWDRTKDAREFFDAYRAYLIKRFDAGETATPAPETSTVYRLKLKTRTITATLKNDRVTIRDEDQ